MRSGISRNEEKVIEAAKQIEAYFMESPEPVEDFINRLSFNVNVKGMRYSDAVYLTILEGTHGGNPNV